MVLDSLGQLSADFIAPRAEDVDRQGNTLNEDGSVTYAKGITESLAQLAKADVMGFTLPHRFGGLNFPNLVHNPDKFPIVVTLPPQPVPEHQRTPNIVFSDSVRCLIRHPHFSQIKAVFIMP